MIAISLSCSIHRKVVISTAGRSVQAKLFTGCQMYLWYGSRPKNWHSIIRNGLKNMSGTPGQQNGTVLGDGIHFGRSSEISWEYSRGDVNGYSNSRLGANLKMISLCEVCNVTSGTAGKFRLSSG
jgi:hypothetical protein